MYVFRGKFGERFLNQFFATKAMTAGEKNIWGENK